LVFQECVLPDYISVLGEIPIQDVAYVVVIEVIRVDHFDERSGFVNGHSRNFALRRATTVPVKRDPHQVYPPIRIDIEVGEDTTALEAQAKAAWPGWCRPNVFGNLHWIGFFWHA
jgi:hypothetical protein